jgi:hypothetical protein
MVVGPCRWAEGSWIGSWFGLRRCQRPPTWLGVHAEHGEAGEVDRGGQQPPVLPDPQQPARAGAPPAMPAAEQVREFAFHGGAVRAVVGPSGGIPLAAGGLE